VTFIRAKNNGIGPIDPKRHVHAANKNPEGSLTLICQAGWPEIHKGFAGFL